MNRFSVKSLLTAFLALSLSISLSIHALRWWNESAWRPLRAECSAKVGGSDIVELIGEYSERFKKEIGRYSAYSDHRIFTKAGETFLRVERRFGAGLNRSLRGMYEDEMMNRAPKFASQVRRDRTGKDTDWTVATSCKFVATWLVHRVGKEKKLDCNYRECRVLGVKKTTGRKP